MRHAFVQTLVDIAARDERVFLLTGDLGFSVLEPFASRFPERFVNVGVAEQNMVGMATGLAEAGYLPFVYSIATFAALRPYEVLRNGAAWHGLPVRVVGVGGGFAYGAAGHTHHALEDVALMRTLPGMQVLVPADSAQASAALNATWEADGPIYYRLGKVEGELVPGLDARFGHGVEQLAPGGDLLILTLGGVALAAGRARERLQSFGVEAATAVVSRVHPAPRAALRALLAEAPLALTVEEHVEAGGLGSLVAEVIAEGGLGCRLVRAAVTALPDGRIGSRDHLRAVHGLDADGLVGRVRRELTHADGS